MRVVPKKPRLAPTMAPQKSGPRKHRDVPNGEVFGQRFMTDTYVSAVRAPEQLKPIANHPVHRSGYGIRRETTVATRTPETADTEKETWFRQRGVHDKITKLQERHRELVEYKWRFAR
jgi:hypothetical protein